MREKIIRNLKAHIKLVCIISAILVSGLVFIIGIYLPSKENFGRTPDPIIASDDIMVVQYWVDNSSTGERIDNSEILREGYHIANGNWSTREFYRVWIQFKIPTILRNWSKCELRVHVLGFVDDNEKGKYGFRIHVNTTWDETMDISEFRDNCDNMVDWDFMDIATVCSTGVIVYDMTEYIENSESITVNFYIQNAHLDYDDYFENMYFEIYTKDSSFSEEFSPQLVWS
ncbi:hypothetical protein LCGC14_1683410 [marine sediment metagenome]|uniref:DNRLRE domain-containing protein n=1 Tax=marine sediment metagenome TaxID=412755 RepID=A0A0F9K3H1_9ZZZZ